jgi:hypothetical protein
VFKYNELSDLKNGELVIPIKREGTKVLCINQKGEEAYYSFKDFDVDKRIEDRNKEDDSSEETVIVDDSSEEEENTSYESVQKETIYKNANYMNITISSYSTYNITLVNGIIIPAAKKITIDLFEKEPSYKQLVNLADKMIVEYEINSIEQKDYIIPAKVNTIKEDSHYATNEEKVSILKSIGYSYKDLNKIDIWSEEI